LAQNIEDKRKYQREYMKEWRRTHPEYLKHQREQRRNPEYREKQRLWAREWRRNNPEKYHKGSELAKRWQHNNIEKHRAQEYARKVPISSNCFKCGSTTQLERHHPDYSKPLEIVTLCDSCHKREHWSKE
jgi:hypothetical protein